MPSFKKDELGKLIVKGGLSTEARFLSLLDELRNNMKPYLDTVSLAKLSEFKCLKDYVWEREVGRSVITGYEDGKSTADIQGIFGKGEKISIPDTGHRYSSGTYLCNGTIPIWGLSRSGDWLLVNVSIVGAAGYKNRGTEVVQAVRVDRVNITDLVKGVRLDPIQIWNQLVRTTQEWAESRERLWKTMLELRAQVVQSDYIVQAAFK
ncbi:MAG: hypothetical protein PHS53_03895 [Candidatus Pacebacteria bacterium]|nr:hypothetical protein [Candidatus Paceibacterota bacterium]MDD5357260.1 hypothetical protein [Candidatus Paceibacterota bacterium]